MEEDRKDNEKMNTILTIGLICFFIGLLAMLSSDNNQWGFILMFLSLVFSIHPIINTIFGALNIGNFQSELT